MTSKVEPEAIKSSDNEPIFFPGYSATKLILIKHVVDESQHAEGAKILLNSGVLDTVAELSILLRDKWRNYSHYAFSARREDVDPPTISIKPLFHDDSGSVGLFVLSDHYSPHPQLPTFSIGKDEYKKLAAVWVVDGGDNDIHLGWHTFKGEFQNVDLGEDGWQESFRENLLKSVDFLSGD